MRRIAFALALCGLATTASLGAPPSDGQSARERAELLHWAKITNQFRLQLGLPSLKSDAALVERPNSMRKFNGHARLLWPSGTRTSSVPNTGSAGSSHRQDPRAGRIFVGVSRLTGNAVWWNDSQSGQTCCLRIARRRFLSKERPGTT
jgi:hypothetical protein